MKALNGRIRQVKDGTVLHVSLDTMNGSRVLRKPTYNPQNKSRMRGHVRHKQEATAAIWCGFAVLQVTLKNNTDSPDPGQKQINVGDSWRSFVVKASRRDSSTPLDGQPQRQPERERERGERDSERKND